MLKIKLHATLIKLLKDIISSNQFVDRHRLTPTAFTRTRSLPFKFVILFLINLLKSSIQNELDKFFKIISNSDLPERVVTSSAFTQARQKLSHKAFIELNDAQVGYFYNNVNYKTWNGFRLLAVDSTTLILPKNEQTIKEFGQHMHDSNCTPVVLARVSQLFDILNKITVESLMVPISTGELDLAVEHIKNTNKNDLILFDRGYNAFWLFTIILMANANFCARINIRNWKAAQQLISSGTKEGLFDIYPSHKAQTRLKHMNLSKDAIKLRFICIELANGQKEVLVTSLLDLEEYPYELFAGLYSNRWLIEESFKFMKCRIEIENFTGKTPEAIKQDLFARIFTSNLTAILSFAVTKCIKKKNNKHLHQINWTQSIAKMKDTIVLLFIRNKCQKIISVLYEHFLLNTIPIRPNRTFPRNLWRPRKRFYITYKPIS